MNRRIQFTVSDDEYARIQAAATAQGLSVSEFARRKIRPSVARAEAKTPDEIFRVLECAMQYNFPTGDIEQMNAEIDMGYSHGLP